MMFDADAALGVRRPAPSRKEKPFRWSLVVTARNEARRLEACLDRIAGDLRDSHACLTIIVNGSTDASPDIAGRFVESSAIPSQAVSIPFADKSNAWNQYVYGLAPQARLHVFVDGYAHVAAGSFAALDRSLEDNGRARAATGVPSGSPGAASEAQALRRGGGLHGTLHALRGELLDRVRNANLRLPIGLYRGDGLIGSFMMHDLDAAGTPWDSKRVAVAPEATWRSFDLSVGSLPRHVRRRINQARGRLESKAIKSLIYPGGFAALPRFADVMLSEFVAKHPEERPHWMDLAGRLAVRRLAHPRMPPETDILPRILVSTIPHQVRMPWGEHARS